MTKVAFGIKSVSDLRARLTANGELHGGDAQITTRYLPRRHDEMVGGSLFWILRHSLVARSPILGFGDAEGGRVAINLDPVLVPVRPIPCRAHQGWRYLEDKDAPTDMEEGEDASELMPPSMLRELGKLGLV